MHNEKNNDDSFVTKRTTVHKMEELLGKKLDIEQKGFIRLIDYLGTDCSIAEAARVSYTGVKAFRDNRGLIRYLMRHQHTSPFEFAEIVIHVRAPLFVARQWYRHRTANVNEISGRYVKLDQGHYTPASLVLHSTNNKQGRSDDRVENESQSLQDIEAAMQNSEKVYHSLSDAGVAHELARIVLPMGTYTEWYWKIDLHNLLRFIRLRRHHTAQQEIRKYANVIESIVEQWAPITYQAFKDYQLDSITLSPASFKCLKLHLQGKTITEETSGMSKGEWKEFCEQILTDLD